MCLHTLGIHCLIHKPLFFSRMMPESYEKWVPGEKTKIREGARSLVPRRKRGVVEFSSSARELAAFYLREIYKLTNNDQ